MCVVPSAVGCPVCHLVFLPRPNAPLHHRFRPPSPPPATWRCLRASYLHRLGRIGAFRTRPPLLPPAFDRWDTTGGTASGDRPIRTHKPMETRVEASPGRHGCIGPCLRPASRGRANVGRICTARGGRNGRHTIHRHLAKGSEPGVKTKHTSQEHHGKKRSHRSSDLVHPQAGCRGKQSGCPIHARNSATAGTDGWRTNDHLRRTLCVPVRV